MNDVMKAILGEMCKRVGADYNAVDFSQPGWFLEKSWTEKEQNDFKLWLFSYFMEDKKRIDAVAAFPSLVKHRKRELLRLCDWIVFDYGWKTKI